MLKGVFVVTIHSWNDSKSIDYISIKSKVKSLNHLSLNLIWGAVQIWVSKCAASSWFRGSHSQFNCSGFPRSLKGLPRQLVIRKLAAISWWKARDRSPCVVPCSQNCPASRTLRWWLLKWPFCPCNKLGFLWWAQGCPAREGLCGQCTWFNAEPTGLGFGFWFCCLDGVF